MLGNSLRQTSSANWSEQVCEKVFREPGALVALAETGGISECIEAVREEAVSRMVGVIEVHGAAGFAGAQLGHAGVAVEVREVRAADSVILIQEET